MPFTNSLEHISNCTYYHLRRAFTIYNLQLHIYYIVSESTWNTDIAKKYKATEGTKPQFGYCNFWALYAKQPYMKVLSIRR